jgi:hypothetical protein
MEGRVIVATIADVCRGDVTRRGQPLGDQSAFLWRESTRWKLAYSVFHNVYYSQATEWVKEMIVGQIRLIGRRGVRARIRVARSPIGWSIGKLE